MFHLRHNGKRTTLNDALKNYKGYIYDAQSNDRLKAIEKNTNNIQPKNTDDKNMLVCKSCGKKVNIGDNFCMYCGSSKLVAADSLPQKTH